MKIKKVESILKSSKTIITFKSNDSCQWIGNGAAFYPVNNLPTLTKENIFAMLDIPENKQDKFYFEERELPEALCFEDTDFTERILDRSEYSINTQGRNLEPLKTSEGISFIDKRLLSPFEKEESGYEIYERTSTSGGIYFAIKSGFLLLGVVGSYDLISDNFIEKLEILLSLSRVAWGNKVERIQKLREQSGLSLEETDESEEV